VTTTSTVKYNYFWFDIILAEAKASKNIFKINCYWNLPPNLEATFVPRARITDRRQQLCIVVWLRPQKMKQVLNYCTNFKVNGGISDSFLAELTTTQCYVEIVTIMVGLIAIDTCSQWPAWPALHGIIYVSCMSVI